METTTHNSSDVPHILLTSLGKNAFSTKYEWGTETATAELAPLALVEFFQKLGIPMPDHVVAVVTKEAETQTWPTFQNGICYMPHFNPVEVKMVKIPNGTDSDEIRTILESVAKSIPKGANLTLDVTHGLRHFPFIFYALVLYLKSLRDVKISGVYYGMVDAGPSKPIIDLQPLLELPEWFHAVRMFRDQGTTKPMADRLQPVADELYKEKEKLFRSSNTSKGKKLEALFKQVNDSIGGLQKYAFAYESALPLELGTASRGLSDSIKELPKVGSAGIPPLVDELTGAIVAAAEKSAFGALPRPPKGGGKTWKETIDLDKDELKRQAYMIDVYLERDQLSLAVGLMREWVVSWAIWKSGKSDDIQKWLNSEVRGRYERILGAIGASARSTGPRFTMTPEQEEFRTFWDQLTDNLRNPLLHNAMRETAVEKTPDSLRTVQCFWKRLKVDGLECVINLPPLGGRLLLSPQGMRPGVLFSALKEAQPDTCLVICSATSVGTILNAAKHAGFEGHIEQIELKDPLGGFDEIDTVAEQVHGYLSYADEVIANMTGGSTLMGVIVQRLVEDAQKLDRPVKRFALIDRRTTEEQDKDPFVQGDSHWLDN